MKKKLLASILLISVRVFANSGGPDGYGYTWKDSNEPGGPTFNWWEISTTGTQVMGLGDDNFVGPIQMGFQFPYYWYTESKVWIGSNGYIEFGPGNLAANFPPIPTASGVNNYIGGMCSDMTFLGNNNPGKVFYKANADSFCVEFQSVPYWDPNFPGYNQTSDNTFEIILNRADSTITVNFMSIMGTSISNFTSGIENNIGNFGLQPLFSQPPGSFYTIKYYYPPTYPTITDVGVDWNDNDGDGGIFLPAGGAAHALVTQVANHGNLNTSPFTADGTVYDYNNNLIVTSSATTVSFVPSQNQIITFPSSFAPTTVGTKYFETAISGVAADTIPVNDSLVQEIVVVDTTLNSIRLSYTNNQMEPVIGSINWAGGAGGVGMYIKPPTYPAKILNTNYIMTMAPGSGLAFFAKIYDDNGPGGSAGTLLDSVAVNVSSIMLNNVTVVPVSNSNLIINSGGVYVNWDMANVNSAIGASYTPPFSRQSYEVFQNIWSTYRDYQTTDFFIGLDYQCVTNNPGFAEFSILDGVSVFPVPSTGSTNFHFDNAIDENFQIIIRDLSGKEVMVQQVNKVRAGETVAADLSHLANGSYSYSIQTSDKCGNGKLILVH